MRTNFDYYTWRQFDADCKKIAAWAKNKKFKNVYGIPRGGLPVTVKLSHLLDLPLILDTKDITPHTLVAEDIVDTGKTAERLFRSCGDNIKIASLYVGPKTKVKPDFFAQKKTKWVVFPWETASTSK